MKPIKITLDCEQSSILADAGTDAFLVVGRGSYPHSAGRFELWIVPSTVKAIDAAVRVARGRSAERKTKPANP